MVLCCAWAIAITSSLISLMLWFRDVRRIMRNLQSVVESADAQLAVCRNRAVLAKGDLDAAAVLELSEDIYRQAVDNYNRTMKKPWNYLPAIIMGFRILS